MPDNWAGYGVLVAVGSSCGIVDRVFDRTSSLLGLFTPMEVGTLPKPGDAAYVEARLLEALVEALGPRVRWTKRPEEAEGSWR